MKGTRHAYIILFATLVMVATPAHAVSVAGWVERAVVYPAGITIHAKLDTGAETSSINLVNPVFYQRDGRRWVRFSVTSREGATMVLERPVVRVAAVKRHFGVMQHRPVIHLEVCVGSIRKTVEVNLVDRTGLNYQFLLGRNFLSGELLVRSGRNYLLPPNCPGKSNQQPASSVTFPISR